ncbi:MAG: flippase-like domain-containing protein [Desulfobacterales bacterium]|nr:flippase-like domain-containing protein [Desulfobacterales bacterium]
MDLNQEKVGKKKKNWLPQVLRFVVSFGAIGLVFYLFRAQLPAVFNHLATVEPRFFCMAVATYLGGLVSTAFRLQLVFKAQDTRISLGNAYYVNIIALFFNNVLPSSLGGEMVKAYYLYRNTNRSLVAFSAVLVDRLFGLATLALIGAAAVLFFDRSLVPPRILGSLGVIIVVTCVAAFILFNQRMARVLSTARVPLVPLFILEKLRQIYLAMHHYRGRREIVASCFLLTIIGQVSYVATTYLLARGLGLDIPFSLFFFLVPILLMITVAPSVNGIGVREATFLFLLANYTTPDKALALSLLTTFFLIFVGLGGGVVYAFKGGLRGTDDRRRMTEDRGQRTEDGGR